MLCNIFYKNKKQFKSIRQKLRKQETKPEKCIWFFIRNKKIGYKFRRQFSIDNYVVDFYCHELKLIIEIDGSDHLYRYNNDKIRQKHLENLGYKIIHYTNENVLSQLEFVIKDIKEKCEEREEELNCSSSY
jgi:cyclase